MSRTDIEAYARLAEQAYGPEVRKAFERIVEAKVSICDLDVALDEARAEVYREQNESAVKSGSCPFDSDGDL
jgi:hypothetical protein